MITATIYTFSRAILFATSVLSAAALTIEPQALEGNLNPSTHPGSSLGYNVFSSDQQELRWCTDLDGSTRSLSLMYSFLVQSNQEIRFDELEKTLVDSIAQQVLKCTTSSADFYEGATSRIVGLGLEVFGGSSAGGVSENFCGSGMHCHVVGRKMIVALEGDSTNDSQLMARVHDSIENSLVSISFDGVKASYISDRPTLARSQSLRASAPSGKNEKSSGFGVFTTSLIAVFSFGSLLVIFTLRYSSGHKENVPTSITISLSLEDDQPTERCMDILPVNLDVEHFVFVDKMEDFHWMRTDLRASPRGYCIGLDTVAEEEELERDMEEEGSI